MKTDKFGNLIFSESDLIDIAMQGEDVCSFKNLIYDNTINIKSLQELSEENYKNITSWMSESDINSDLSVEQFDKVLQSEWFMPEEYKQLDIAAYVLGLCDTQAQLQRAGEELLLFQEKNLFDLLRYLKYLVDVMSQNNIIWGVGRGSSVSSYVLFLLKVHKIDSLYYDLDPKEFLR